MKPGFAAKISALAISLVLVTVGVVGIIVFIGYDAILVREELGSLGDEARLAAVQLVSGIEALRQDVLFLSATPPIQGLVRAQAADGVDPLDGSTEAEWRDRLADIFTQFLNAKPAYLQVSYIGADGEGRELVRVLRSGAALVTAADEELQPTADTPYFQETVQLPAGEVYLSEITLNRESGPVIEPYTPVLRAAAPVYTSEGEIFGIVVIKVDYGAKLAGIEHEQQRTLFITNDAGDFLAHPDPAMTFGFELGERHRILESYPELAPLFEPGNGEQEIAFRSEATGRSEAVHFLKVAFDPGRPERFLGLALAASYSDVVAASTALRSRSVTLAGLLIAGAGVLAFAFSRRLTRPLSQIAQAVQGFAGGAMDVSLPLEAGDEIGVLARTFSDMIRKVNERTEALRESQDRYRTLFELAGDAILMVLPPEGAIRDANQAAEQLLG
ncbi:MAG: HAMP domain-containing protein, partial [Anaerolineae bacterium]